MINQTYLQPYTPLGVMVVVVVLLVITVIYSTKELVEMINQLILITSLTLTAQMVNKV